MRFELVMVLAAIACGLAAAQTNPMANPVAPKRPVTDTYHGVAVTDDYRWLEDYHDPAVRQWADAENKTARYFLDNLPARDAILAELRAWDARNGPSYGSIADRGRIFALKFDPRKQHPALVTFSSVSDLSGERALVDPDQLDSSHSLAIDFFSPSPDGRYVAVSLSHGGSESGDVRVFDAATGSPLPDLVPRVNGGTAGGSVAWSTVSERPGFFYTRYPRGHERAAADMDFYQQVWFHRLGDPTESDVYSIGKEFPRVAEIALRSSRDGRNIAATVAIGDGGDFEHWILTPGQSWRQLARVSDEVKQVAFGFHDDVYLLSDARAPRGRILHMGNQQTLDQATTAVEQSDVAIEAMLPAPGGLCVVDLAGGPSQARFFPSKGAAMPIPLPPVSAVNGVVVLSSGAFFVNVGGYLTPPSWFLFDPKRGDLQPTALRRTPPIPTGDYEVLRSFATSRDGARIPINIVRRKGIALDGSHPTLLTGYGGFGISISPSFSNATLVLLERGFVFAEANLRGGGEYGEEWRQQGRLTRKQNVFDDFAAAAQYLITEKYTRPERLGIEGGSNGGLLMGAELTQHPELFGAVVAEVGIFDMLRNELTPNGGFNVTEYGTVKEADQFRALLAYSPYQHVHDGTHYPPVLFMTGDNDPRVDPMNSRKMTARLQAAQPPGGPPILLRTAANAGHGFGTSKDEAFAQVSDLSAFLIFELGGNSSNAEPASHR